MCVGGGDKKQLPHYVQYSHYLLCCWSSAALMYFYCLLDFLPDVLVIVSSNAMLCLVISKSCESAVVLSLNPSVRLTDVRPIAVCEGNIHWSVQHQFQESIRTHHVYWHQVSKERGQHNAFTILGITGHKHRVWTAEEDVRVDFETLIRRYHAKEYSSQNLYNRRQRWKYNGFQKSMRSSRARLFFRRSTCHSTYTACIPYC